MRVLPVDDDAKLAQALAKGPHRHAYAVDMAEDRNAVLLRAGVHEYDVVLLDVMPPGGDGYTACRSLRERGDAVPVLMLTARDAVYDRIRGLDAGADHYPAKPLALVVSRRAERFLASARRSTAPARSVGTITPPASAPDGEALE